MPAPTKSAIDWFIYAGAFITAFGAYLLFLKTPATNEQQQLFRIGVLVVGLILGGVALVIKLFVNSRRRSH